MFFWVLILSDVVMSVGILKLCRIMDVYKTVCIKQYSPNHSTYCVLATCTHKKRENKQLNNLSNYSFTCRVRSEWIRSKEKITGKFPMIALFNIFWKIIVHFILRSLQLTLITVFLPGESHGQKNLVGL